MIATSAPRSSDEREAALERQKAITAEINQIPLRTVMEALFGFRGKKGGVNMLKYEVSPGFYLNCSTTENWFASFNGAPIPGLNGRNPNAAHGAINAVIAVRTILGDRCDFKQARQELQHMFLPHSLDHDYVPLGTTSRAASLPKVEDERESPKDLPARFNTADEYLRSTRTRRCEPVLKLPDDLHAHVRHYLTTTRKIPAPVVDDLMQRNAAFPSVRERQLVSRRTGRPYALAEPIVVFPLVSWRAKFVIGYDYKTLPTDPEFASFAASEGRKKFGAFQIGPWDDNTRHVVLTEAAVDAISKWVLERPARDTCIWGMSGARTSEILIAECKRRSIDVRAAFDNDRAGRVAAAATLRQCREFGVPCETEFVRPSEIDFALKDDADASARIEALTKLCRAERIPLRIEEPEAGLHRGVVANDASMIELFTRFCDDDQLDRITAEAAGHAPRALEPRVHYGIRNKDWNDVLKGGFEPRLPPSVDPTAELTSRAPAVAECQPLP